MKIVFLSLSTYSSEGGIQRFGRLLLKAFADLQKSAPGVHVQTLSLFDSPHDEKKIPAGFLAQHFARDKIKMGLATIQTILREKPAVVIFGHILFVPLAPLMRLLSPKTAQYLVVYGRDVWGKPKPLHRLLIHWFIDRILSISNLTTMRMSQLYGIPTEKFLLLYLCLPPENPAPELAPAPVKLEGTRRLVTVTRLDRDSRHKHIDKVIQAMPQIVMSYPDAHYYIIGDGDWRPELEELARSTGVSDNIHFMGRAPDQLRNAICHGSHVFVLPSVGEGFGLVYLEAWLLGLPVIAGNDGAAPEIVRDGLDGFCVSPDPGQIANAAVKLFSDETLRQEMAVSGAERVASLFSYQNFFETVQKIFT
jgi:glycosyltransferase involved in cell wall biosynthesis